MDRLTQLQDRVDLLSFHCHRAIDQLPAYVKPNADKTGNPAVAVTDTPVIPSPQILGENGEEAEDVFSDEIIGTMKEIELIIDSLPSVQDNYEEQMNVLERLEKVNEESGQNLREAIAKGELYLGLIRAALDDIGDMALKAEPQPLEDSEYMDE
eukprot:CFRG3389T1